MLIHEQDVSIPPDRSAEVLLNPADVPHPGRVRCSFRVNDPSGGSEVSLAAFHTFTFKAPDGSQCKLGLMSPGGFTGTVYVPAASATTPGARPSTRALAPSSTARPS